MQFITSCPTSNPALPVQPFPALTLSEGAPAHGATITATIVGDKAGSGETFIAWLDGLDVVFSDLKSDGTTTVPEGLAGTVYAVAVSSKDKALSEGSLRSGLAVVQFPFTSKE